LNKYYDPGQQRAAKVHELFGKIAPRYDLMNDLQSFGLHRYWKRRLVRLAAPVPGLRALDVCCGTGDLAFALARRGADVIGVDFSERMLQVAESKVQSPSSFAKAPADKKSKAEDQGPVSSNAARCTLHTPRFLQADAQALPFPDNTFDIVTVGYGLRNLERWEAGLSEMQRVAKPSGRVLVLDFGKPENRLWRWIYFNYLALFIPLLGRIFCGDAGAYAYILESLKHFPAQRGIEHKMRELGLAGVKTINIFGGVMGINYGLK